MDYLQDMPGSDALIDFVKDSVGRDHILFDVSNVWAASWMNHLDGFRPRLFKVIGNKVVRANLPRPELKFFGSGILELTVGGGKVVMFQYSTEHNTSQWLFVGREDSERAQKLIEELLAKELAARELYIWGHKDIPLDNLDTRNFVLPSYVDRTLAREVYPQLESGSIFNHVLLYSYPGVGKTAFCRWLAKKYPEWKTIIVFPSSIEKPLEMLSVFSYASYRKPSILVFEDIDTWAQTRFDDYSTSKESFSPYLGALLNAIDGIETHEKLLVVATTNNPECLDPAIIRPGRFGIQVEFRYSEEELVQVCNNYLGTKKDARFYAPFIRNSPAHLRTLMRTARAHSVLHGAKVDRALLKGIDKMLKGRSPRLPKLEDMFIGPQDKAESSPEYR
ncbi:MAG: ATP-binding protein [Candidatus Thermoplasmatota archaeon]|nr:ATP-binding protein [Candidatus Thermoplasmatota archaeon]